MSKEPRALTADRHLTWPPLLTIPTDSPTEMVSASYAEPEVYRRRVADDTVGSRSTWEKLVPLFVRRIARDTDLHDGALGIGQRSQRGARVVEGEDLGEAVALTGSLPGAPLAQAHAVAVAAAYEDEVLSRRCSDRLRSRDRLGRGCKDRAGQDQSPEDC